MSADTSASQKVAQALRKPAPPFGLEEYDPTYDARQEGARMIEALAADVASLRLTLGMRTFSADVPEPIGCPAPGACAQVAEIKRLAADVARLRGALQQAIQCIGDGCEDEADKVLRAALAGDTP
jgi:hypothetical protein